MTLIERIQVLIGMIGADIKALNQPTLLVNDSVFDIKYKKPDGSGGWVDALPTDNGAVIYLNGLISGSQPETLPAPVFGTATITQTDITLPVTNLPSGAAVVWTVSGVVDGDTDATLNKTGLTAGVEYVITAKFTKAGVTDSAVSSITLTTQAQGGSYTVERTIRINLEGEYANASGLAAWNDLLIPAASIGVDNGYTSPALKTETGAVTAVTLTNPKKWGGATGQVLGTYPATALYPASIGNTSVQFNSWDAPPSLKINGLNGSKFYQIHVAVLSDNNGDVMNVGIGADVKTKTSYNNVGLNTDTELSSPIWTIFNDKQGTEITIDFSKNSGGTAFHATAIIIEETNIAKP